MFIHTLTTASDAPQGDCSGPGLPRSGAQGMKRPKEPVGGSNTSAPAQPYLLPAILPRGCAAFHQRPQTITRPHVP